MRLRKNIKPHISKIIYGALIGASILLLGPFFSWISERTVLAEKELQKIHVFPGLVSTDSFTNGEAAQSQDLTGEAGFEEFNILNSAYLITESDVSSLPREDIPPADITDIFEGELSIPIENLLESINEEEEATTSPDISNINDEETVAGRAVGTTSLSGDDPCGVFFVHQNAIPLP